MREDLQFSIGADTGTFARGLRGAKGMVKDFTDQSKRSFDMLKGGIAAAFSVGAFKAMFDGVSNLAEQIKNLSTVTGASTDFVQGFSAVVGTSGGTAEGAKKAMEQLALKIADARQGASAAIETFQQWGIELNNTNGTAKSFEEVMSGISNKMMATTDNAEKARMAVDLFGNKGLEVVTALSGGWEELNKQIAATPKLTQKSIDSINEFKDSVSVLWRSFQIVFGNLFGWLNTLAEGIGYASGSIEMLAKASKAQTLAEFARLYGEASVEYDKLKAHAEAVEANLKKKIESALKLSRRESAQRTQSNEQAPTTTPPRAVSPASAPTVTPQPAPRGTGRSYDEVVAASVAYEHEMERRDKIRARVGDPRDAFARGGMDLISYAAMKENEAATMGNILGSIESSKLIEQSKIDSARQEALLERVGNLLESIQQDGLPMRAVMGR